MPAAPATAPVAAPEAEARDAEPLARIDDHLRQLLDGRPLDAHGMQTLQRELNVEMQEYLKEVVAFQNTARLNGERLFPVQFTAVSPDGDVHALYAGRTEKAAFLGVSTSPVSTFLHEQLDIPRGMGLVVDYIEKDSPADAAGLKVHDVLQKIDDQWLVNPQQLAVLVRSKKAGDSLSITVLRGGKPTTISAKLGEKELPLLEDMLDPDMFTNPNAAPLNPLNMRVPDVQEFVNPPHSSHVSVTIDNDGGQTRTLIDDQNYIALSSKADGTSTLVVKDRAGQKVYEGPADKADLAPELQAKVDDLRKRNNTVTVRSNGSEVHAEAITLKRADADDVITLRVDSHGRTLTVQDVKAGKTVYQGPANTEEELKSLPAAIQEKVRALDAKAKSDLANDAGGNLAPGRP